MVGAPAIFETSGREAFVCRCGTHLAPGDPLFLVEGVPADVREVFEGRAFCSVRCIRAFCLEALEALEALDTPKSRAVVTDLHDLYQALAMAFVQILGLH